VTDVTGTAQTIVVFDVLSPRCKTVYAIQEHELAANTALFPINFTRHPVRSRGGFVGFSETFNTLLDF